MTVFDSIATPLGELLVAAEVDGVTDTSFETYRRARRPTTEWVPMAEASGPAVEVLAEARRQVGEYFAGRLTLWTLPLVLHGSPFQLRVLAALREIPYGEMISYAELARRIGEPGSARAVGLANALNPIPLVIPCHRVIGSDGSLTGFGGGVERKAWLLRHERARRGDQPWQLPFTLEA